MEKTKESTALKTDDTDKKGTVVLLQTVLTPDNKTEAAKTERPPDSKSDDKTEAAKAEKPTAKPKAVKKSVKEEKSDSKSEKKPKATKAAKPDSESDKKPKATTAAKPDPKSDKKSEPTNAAKPDSKSKKKTEQDKAEKPVAKLKSTAQTDTEKTDTKSVAVTEQNPTVPNPSAVAEQPNMSPQVVDSPLKMMKQEFNERANVIRQEMKHIQNSFLVIGFQLHWIHRNKMYRILDYKNIYDYAEKEYHIKKSTCGNLISIIENFAERDANGEVIEELVDTYRNFSSSQLLAMIGMPDEIQQQVTPDMSVRTIQRLRKGEPETPPVDVTATTVTDVKKEETPPVQEPASSNSASEKAASAESEKAASPNPVSEKDASAASAPPISEAKAATAIPPVQKTEITEKTGAENESPKESAVVDDTAKDSGKQEEAALENDNTLMEIDSYNDYQNMTDKLDVMMKHVFSGNEPVRVKILCVYG